MPVNFLNLPGLDVTDFKETEFEYHVKAAPKAISRLCPHCGRSHETVVHARRTLVIRDVPSHGKAVVIHLDVPRLKCRPCNQTFTASVPEVDTGREMTERLVKWVGRQAIEYPYAEIAKQVRLDEKTIRNVFDDYVAERIKGARFIKLLIAEYAAEFSQGVDIRQAAMPHHLMSLAPFFYAFFR